jgi:AcrR family transcriptional regulator
MVVSPADAQALAPRSAEGRPGESVRERTRRAVRAEIAAVAFDLFVEHGLANVTADEIATAVGVSRATFFRYFAAKEDVVLEGLERLGADMRDVLVLRPEGEAPWQALRASFDVAVAANVRDADRSVRLSTMLAEAPSLRARHAQKLAVWQDFLVPEVRRRLGGGDEVLVELRANTVVAAALACLNTAVDVWRQRHAEGAATSDAPDLARLVDLAMAAVRVDG